MAASTIPAAEDALLAALEARSGLAGVRVLYGRRADLPQVDEAIYLTDPVDVEREWASIGAQKLNEAYVLIVNVEVFAQGEDQATARALKDRMWAIVAEVEQAVRDDLTLAGTLTRSPGARPDGVEPSTLPVADGWVAHAVVRIACKART